VAAKTIKQSRSVISDLIQPSQANPAGNAHGGEIMKMMDNCGGVAAMRHAKTNVVTIRVDELIFYNPVYVGQLVTCEAELVYVGRTSMEVKITVKVEDMKSECDEKIALSAYFTYVALDKNGVPCEVPRLLTQTDEEREAFEMGHQRYLAHKRNK
jgi:Acyl-CoA hydrolase